MRTLVLQIGEEDLGVLLGEGTGTEEDWRMEDQFDEVEVRVQSEDTR